MFVNALYRAASLSGYGGNTSGVGQNCSQGFSRSQLIDGWITNTTEHCGLRAHRGNKDDVSRQQRSILRLVAQDEQIVEVEAGHNLASTAQLNRTHRAFNRWPPAREESVNQRAQ